VQFGPDGKKIATASFDLSTRLYTCEVCLSDEQLLALAQARQTRSFTTAECQKFLHENLCPATPWSLS
jgi:hypothetical protein